MKSNAPWSVKGIERDARETAKAAAQREGMTVGEWLNQIIYTAGDPDAPATEGDIEGLRARDLAAAIEHLSKRIAIAETKGASAVDNLARSLGGAVERLQRLERAEPAEGSDAALAARVKTLEEKGADRQRIEALRALERAVGQIAVQFTSAQQSTVARLDATEKQLQSIAERVTGEGAGETVSANAVREAIEGMAERVARAEKIAAEASQLKAEAGESVDADFIHKTGLRLRILGDEIKRGGDQMRTLETTISRMSQQIDAAEKRSAEGVQKVAETIADLRTQFASADTSDQAAARAEIEAAVSEIAQRTEDRIETLQQSFDDMVRRLEGAAGGSPEALHEDADEDDQPAPRAAAFAAAPLPKVESGPLDDIDSDLDDAFAALELEDPIPTPSAAAPSFAPSFAPPPIAQPQSVQPKPATPKADLDDDDFGFDADDETDRTASDSSETEDVLAEIREAFGIDAPEHAEEEAETADNDLGEAGLEDIVESEAALPPMADDAPAPQNESATDQADYLKAARRAAREAAAKAAAAEEAAPKKKLTPKQRAILAARIKRRKAEAEIEKAATPAFEAAPLAADYSDDDEPEAGSIKARIAGLVAKIKSRATGKDAKEPVEAQAATLDAPVEDLAEPGVNPSLISGASAALKKFNLTPTGGVLGLGVAIVLLLAALFFLTKDILGRGKAPAPTQSQSVEAPAAVTPEAPDANERIEPAIAPALDATVRPRELYLDNIAVLKSATTDGEAKAALKHIEEAAALGHPPAQLQIGELYKLGQLYDRDLGMARQWFERAANGGNVLAMHRLGVMAARGEGGPVDPAASIGWFEKAASFGLVDSQYNLGATFHPTPEGASGGSQANIQNRAKAYFWYSIAARNGDTQAGEMAAGLAGSMPAAERSAKDAEVDAWAPKTPDPRANELAPAN